MNFVGSLQTMPKITGDSIDSGNFGELLFIADGDSNTGEFIGIHENTKIGQ